jgi:DNA-binding CsgD family transcriptional regulator
MSLFFMIIFIMMIKIKETGTISLVERTCIFFYGFSGDMDLKTVRSEIQKAKREEDRECLVLLYDCARSTFSYVSPGFKSLLGYDISDFYTSGLAFFENICLPLEIEPFFISLAVFEHKIINDHPNEISECSLEVKFRIKGSLDDIRWLHLSVSPRAVTGRAIPLLLFTLKDVLPPRDNLMRCALKVRKEIYKMDPFEFCDRKGTLSTREVEILGLIKKGRSSKDMMSLLNLSIHTVNRHRKNILRKLNAKNMMEALLLANEMGLVD